MFIYTVVLPLFLAFHSVHTFQFSSRPRNPFRSVQSQLADVPPISFNTSVIQNEQCRADVEFWWSSLNAFIGAMTTTCNTTDTVCQAELQANLSANMFAAQQLDSFGRIPSNLLNFNNIWQGSYEECMNLNVPSRSDYKGQFCWAKLATPIALIASPAAAAAAQEGQDLCAVLEKGSMLTSWSVCMPRSCPDSDIHAVLQTVNLLSSETEVTLCSTKCRPYKLPEKDGSFWFVTMYLSLVVLAVIVASAVDYYMDCEQCESFKQLRRKTGMKCLLAFSMYTNASEILNIQKRPGQIECLNCIRVVSLTWVVAGHILMMFMYSDDMMKMMQLDTWFLNVAFTNGFFSVDSFLFIGGLLMGYLFIKEMDRNPSKIRSPVYWFLFYAHRILRLGIPYYLFIGFNAVFAEYLTQGPAVVDNLMPNSACRDHWWRNVLYINNLYDLTHMCLGQSWYLAVDMQIHIFAPLLLVPLFLSPIAGGISALLLIGLSTGLNYWLFFKYDAPATFMGFFRPNTASVDLSVTMNFMQKIYFASWIRFTPYVIGALTGYFLYKTKGKKLRLHPLIALAIWICAAAMGVACVYAIYDYLKGKDLSTSSRASYYNWSRIGWSFSLAWVVIACERNWAGPIKKFMEMGFWAPFGRLGYCTYLTHFTLLYAMFAMQRQSLHFVSMTEMYICWCLPAYVIGYAFGFLWSCAFEIPGGKLEKMGIEALFGGGAPRRDAPPPKPVEKSPANGYGDMTKAVAVVDLEKQNPSTVISNGPESYLSKANGTSTPSRTVEDGINASDEEGLKRRTVYL